MKLIRRPKSVVKIVFDNNVQLTMVTATEYNEMRKDMKDALANKGIRQIDSLTEEKNMNIGMAIMYVDFDHVYCISVTEILDASPSLKQQERVIDAEGNVKQQVTLEAPPPAQ